MYSTLQSQLSAIAREYALPSTSGMVLYLITTNGADDSEEPGPRLSEEIWRHIWMRVLKVEREEMLASGPKPLGLGLGLGYGMASRSSPTLLQDVATASQLQASSFRPFIQNRLTETPQPTGRATTPSPSTTYSAYSSLSEIDTLDSATSADPPTHANSLSLPGLHSNLPLPILAKVEFDIDKRKAGWYDTWVRSRKVNHAKRAESRAGGRNGTRSESQMEEGEEGTRKAPIDLALVGKMNGAGPSPNFVLTTETSAEPEAVTLDEEVQEGYQQLEDDENDHISEAELTTRLNEESLVEDPLEDVFGSDADTWAIMHQSAPRKCDIDPSVVHLALDAEEVSNLPDDLEADDIDRLPGGNDENEISSMLARMTRPVLSVTVPQTSAPPFNRQSTPTTAGPLKKSVPPPLDLQVPYPSHLVTVEQPSPMSGGPGSAHLAYLADEPPAEHDSENEGNPDVGEDDYTEEELMAKARSPEDEKRIGVFYNALNLGLDPSLTEDGDVRFQSSPPSRHRLTDSTQYDDSDPYDRRKSQYIMAAQLDEIERVRIFVYTHDASSLTLRRISRNSLHGYCSQTS